MIDRTKTFEGLEWILENDQFGFGINWSEDSIPKSEEEQAGYNIQMAMNFIKEQPEIVRCEHCRFHDNGENEVDAWNRCKLHKINTSDDEFCSWGVKRE